MVIGHMDLPPLTAHDPKFRPFAGGSAWRLTPIK